MHETRQFWVKFCQKYGFFTKIRKQTTKELFCQSKERPLFIYSPGECATYKSVDTLYFKNLKLLESNVGAGLTRI